MLGALGALIRKDERTLFNKHTDGLYVSAPKLSQEMEEEFTEELGYEIQRKLLDRWPFELTDKSWSKLKTLFEQSRLRILYTSEESHEWVLYTKTHYINTTEKDSKDENKSIDSNLHSNNTNNKPRKESSNKYQILNDMSNYGFNTNELNIENNTNNIDDECIEISIDIQCLGGVYQKFNFEFGDGKFHDIVSMGTTKNIGWDVLNASCFDPYVLWNVGNILNLQRKINNKYEVSVPAEIWHIIMGFAIDCFQPISQMMEVDIVLRDVRRWTQNLYLSENLRRRDEFGDNTIRKLGQLFIEIGGMIDSEYIKYRKQFSLRKKFVRFMKYKFGEITNSTSQKLKNLKNNEKGKDNDNDKDKDKDKNKKGLKRRNKRDKNDIILYDGGYNKKGKKYKQKHKKHRHKHKHRHKNRNDNNNNNNNMYVMNREYVNDNDNDNGYEHQPQHMRCHTLDVNLMSNYSNDKLDDSSLPRALTINKSADI